jgi:hypothetical protein
MIPYPVNFTASLCSVYKTSTAQEVNLDSVSRKESKVDG